MYGPFYQWELPGMGVLNTMSDPDEYLKVLHAEGSHPNGAIQLQWPVIKAAKAFGWEIAKDTGDDPNDVDGYWGNGATWKRLRTFMQTDLLSPISSKKYIPGMLQAAASASKGAPTGAADMKTYTALCSFDMFSSVLYGQLTHLANDATPSDPDHAAFCQHVINLTDLLIPLSTIDQYEIFMGKFFNIETKMYKEFAASFQAADELSRKFATSFEGKMEKGELNEYEQNSYFGHAVERQTEGNKDGTTVSIDEMRELCNFGLLASVDTTSSVLNWTLLHLALNPGIQQRLYEEIKREGVEADKIGKRKCFPYLHAVIREQHRLTPALPIAIFKKNSKPKLTVHGVDFDEGATFMFDSQTPQNDAKLVGPDVKSFVPERWLPDAVQARVGTPSQVIDHILLRDPFSAGARKCPGSRVAILELHCLLTTLVNDWKFELEDKSITLADVDYSQGTTVQPTTMPKFVFEPRK